MIVRILGEGQFEVDDELLPEFEELDAAVFHALEADDEKAFHAALAKVAKAVHESGKAVAAEVILPSDLVVPREAATMEEVRELLASEDTAEG